MGKSSEVVSSQIVYQPGTVSGPVISGQTGNTTAMNAAAGAVSGLFTKDLRHGTVSNDVKLLQKFLNAHGYTISKSGAGSPGKETNVFGLATKDAVVRFQKANSIKPANGSFGPLTRKAVNGMK